MPAVTSAAGLPAPAPVPVPVPVPARTAAATRAPPLPAPLRPASMHEEVASRLRTMVFDRVLNTVPPNAPNA